jgi:RNA polymerase subunit RPABC4/transcription elongation factor Spt4
MTDKICKKCGTYTPEGRFCPKCGAQLYPDVGNTKWIILLNDPDKLKRSRAKRCITPKFNVDTGEKL